MTIGFVSGNVRQGKTLKNAGKLIRVADAGFKVIANFNIFDCGGKGVWLPDKQEWSGRLHSNFEFLTPHKLVELMFGVRNERTVYVGIQEAYAEFSSHKSLSDVNDLEAAFVFQSGKMNFDILADSQLTSRVEGAIRKLANERWKAVFNEDTDCFEYYGLDVNEPDKDVVLEEFEDDPIEVSKRVAASWWNRYDTWQRTFPLGFSRMVEKVQALDNDVKRAKVERQVDLLFGLRLKYGFFSPKDVTKAAVDYALMMERELGVFSAYVAVGLKLRM